MPYASAPRFDVCALTRCLLRHGFHLVEHFFDSSPNFFAVFAQLHHLAAQRLQFFIALIKLFAQTLHVPLSHGLGLTRRFVHLNRAINFGFQRLEIVGGNLSRYLFKTSARHVLLPEKRFWSVFWGVYPRNLWERRVVRTS